MPNFVDYSTENMNGTPVHTFVDANGQASPPMYGDQANSLAANIDQFKQFQAANSGPDLRVAGPGGGVPEDSVMAGSGAISSSEPAPASPNQSVGPAASSPPQPAAGPAPTYSQADADAAQQKGPPVAPGFSEQQQAQAIHDAAAHGNPVAGQVDPGAYINRPVHTAGVSRAQLEQRAANVVATPKSGEETVEGAVPYDRDAAEARAQANIDLRLAKQQQADLMAQRAERDAAIFDQQAAIAATKLQHEQQKQQLVEDGVQHDMQIARDYRDQVAKQQVDPGRLFSGDRGAFNTIAAVIGQGLGAFAAAGGGSPTVNGRRAAAGGQNYAKDIIDGAINRDIAAQEFNIRSNQASANNQLNDVYKRLGDMTQAKAVVRQMQTDYAGLQMKQLAARDGSQDAMNAFDQWDAANAADRAEQERKFAADSYGKHTIKVAQSYVSPQAGGTRAPTEAEINQRITTQKNLGELGAQGQTQATDLALKQSEVRKNEAEAAKAQNPTNNPAATEYGKNIQFVDSAQGAFKSALQRAGGHYDPGTGEITWSKEVPGAGLTRAFWQSDDAKKLSSAIGISAPAMEKGVEGDAAGEAGIAQIKESLTSGNEAQRKAAWEQLGKTLAERRRSVDSGVDPALRAQRQNQALQGAIGANRALQLQQQAEATSGGVRPE
jgi:hypothetical protein